MEHLEMVYWKGWGLREVGWIVSTLNLSQGRPPNWRETSPPSHPPLARVLHSKLSSVRSLEPPPPPASPAAAGWDSAGVSLTISLTGPSDAYNTGPLKMASYPPYGAHLVLSSCREQLLSS